VIENATGTTCEQDIDYYPYGGAEHDYCGTVPQNYKFTGKERDSDSMLDYFGARYDASGIGRFMTPDPLGGDSGDPQSMNKYAYARNNPLAFTDPSGMNFGLPCEGESDNCSNGLQGSWGWNSDQGTFTFTAVSIGNQNGQLRDVSANNTGEYTTTISEAGVSFTGGGNQGAIGIFINGTNPTTIQGNGSFSGFTFTFTGSDISAHLNATGTFKYDGNADQAIAALQKAGLRHYGWDSWDPLHPSGQYYDAFDLRGLGGKGGAGAGHFVVDKPVLRFEMWKIPENGVPTFGTEDLGTTNPWNGGFGTHAQEVINHYFP
jgi:RHS repeat-associated protein